MTYFVNGFPTVMAHQWISGVIFGILFFSIIPINSILAIILTSGTLSRLSLSDLVVLLHSVFNVIAGLLIPLMTMTLLYQSWSANVDICYSLHVAEDALLGCALVFGVCSLCYRWKLLASWHTKPSKSCSYKNLIAPIQVAVVLTLSIVLTIGASYSFTAYLAFTHEYQSHTLVCLANIQILHGCRLLNAVSGVLELALCGVLLACSAAVATCTAASYSIKRHHNNNALETSEVSSYNCHM